MVVNIVGWTNAPVVPSDSQVQLCQFMSSPLLLIVINLLWKMYVMDKLVHDHMLYLWSRNSLEHILSPHIHSQTCVTAVVWEVNEALEPLNGIPVISITCDGISSNQKFFKLCKIDNIHLTHKTVRDHMFIYLF